MLAPTCLPPRSPASTWSPGAPPQGDVTRLVGVERRGASSAVAAVQLAAARPALTALPQRAQLAGPAELEVIAAAAPPRLDQGNADRDGRAIAELGSPC